MDRHEYSDAHSDNYGNDIIYDQMNTNNNKPILL